MRAKGAGRGSGSRLGRLKGHSEFSKSAASLKASEKGLGNMAGQTGLKEDIDD